MEKRMSFILEDEDQNDLASKSPSHIFEFEGKTIVVFTENCQEVFTIAFNDEKNQTIITDKLDDDFRLRLEQYFYLKLVKSLKNN